MSANPAPPVAAAAAIVAITGLTYAGNLFAQDAEAYTETASVQVIGSGMNCGQYADGTYTGSASGYKGTTTVQVTVENGYITGVEVLSTDDDREFFNMAESSIIAGVLRTQSTDVDTVTGATFSSNAILNAVSDALGTMGSCNSNMLDAGSLGEETNASAAGNGTGANGSAASAEEETNAAAAEIEVSNLEDGVYSGTGTGFRGAITVSVTVSDGKITDITVVSQQEDREYFDRADDTMISRDLSAQSGDVDTVSGATYSSDGILEAVADALGQTYESSSPAAEASQHGGGHGRRA